MEAAKAFFGSAKAVAGITPARVTADGHGSYPRAIQTGLDEGANHRTNQHLDNRIEQDHRKRCPVALTRLSWSLVLLPPNARASIRRSAPVASR
jgi:transposase-like protein